MALPFNVCFGWFASFQPLSSLSVSCSSVSSTSMFSCSPLWSYSICVILVKIFCKDGFRGALILGRLFSCRILFSSGAYVPGSATFIICACIMHMNIFIWVSLSGGVVVAAAAVVLVFIVWLYVLFFLSLSIFVLYNFFPFGTFHGQNSVISVAVYTFLTIVCTLSPGVSYFCTLRADCIIFSFRVFICIIVFQLIAPHTNFDVILCFWCIR